MALHNLITYEKGRGGSIVSPQLSAHKQRHGFALKEFGITDNEPDNSNANECRVDTSLVPVSQQDSNRSSIEATEIREIQHLHHDIFLKMATSKETVEAEWQPAIPAGPQLAFHTGCVIKQCLYVHGGVTKLEDKQPSNRLYKVNLCECIWKEILSPDSPALSHHVSVAIDDRYILLIGGWNGKARTGKLFVFDTETDAWHFPDQHGFPSDAGLSSHTATYLANGDIMILGREGSLRSQRRYGNAYLLKGSVEKGFKFSEFSRSVTSRSGHTTNIIGSKMYVIGGRSDKLLELQAGFRSGSNNLASSLKILLEKCKILHPMTKIPCGRKHHVSMSGPDVIFLHGGETFDGRNRDPVGEMFLVILKPVVSFYKLGDSRIKRAGHVSFTDGQDVFIHGGYTGKSTVCGDIQRLVI